MVKVFFADAGSRAQLLATLHRIEDEAAERLAALAEMAASDPAPFPSRLHLSALGLRMQYDQEGTSAMGGVGPAPGRAVGEFDRSGRVGRQARAGAHRRHAPAA
jgi:hypothetical protein